MAIFLDDFFKYGKTAKSNENAKVEHNLYRCVDSVGCLAHDSIIFMGSKHINHSPSEQFGLKQNEHVEP